MLTAQGRSEVTVNAIGGHDKVAAFRQRPAVAIQRHMHGARIGVRVGRMVRCSKIHSLDRIEE
jgi:hypothetical protein